MREIIPKLSPGLCGPQFRIPLEFQAALFVHIAGSWLFSGFLVAPLQLSLVKVADAWNIGPADGALRVQMPPVLHPPSATINLKAQWARTLKHAHTKRCRREAVVFFTKQRMPG